VTFAEYHRINAYSLLQIFCLHKTLTPLIAQGNLTLNDQNNQYLHCRYSSNHCILAQPRNLQISYTSHCMSYPSSKEEHAQMLLFCEHPIFLLCHLNSPSLCSSHSDANPMSNRNQNDPTQAKVVLTSESLYQMNKTNNPFAFILL